MNEFEAIAEDLRSNFAADPVPPYPPMMGMDPMGVDEYAAFAGIRWTEVPPHCYGQWYDISPPNGFSSYDPPYMWNYHVPGFLCFSLSGQELAADALDSFMFFFRRCEPIYSSSHDVTAPWWKSDTFSGGYSRQQVQVVVNFLLMLEQSGGDPPLHHDWEDEDAETLDKWIARLNVKPLSR